MASRDDAAGPPGRVLVIDCVPAHDEVELLRARIEYLRDDVDLFLVAEGTHTFSGLPKPPALGAAFEGDPKVRVVGVPLGFQGDAWARERSQRDALGDEARRAADRAGAAEFVCLQCDADEIPSREAVRALRALDRPPLQPLSREMTMLYYSPRWHGPELVWRLPAAVWGSHLREHTMTQTRQLQGRHGLVRGAGWHLSSFMTPARLARKLRSYSHTEHAWRADDADRLRECMELGIDVFRGGNLLPHDPALLPEAFRALRLE